MTFVPVIPEAYSHVLAEFESLDPLLTALRLDSSRLKVNFCFETESYVAHYFHFISKNVFVCSAILAPTCVLAPLVLWTLGAFACFTLHGSSSFFIF